MAARIIDGKAIGARVRAEVARGVQEFEREAGRAPGLATVLVGDDPASAIYVGSKQRACREAGMVAFDVRLPATASFEEIAAELERLNEDETVDGVLLQLPLPGELDGTTLSGMVVADKDVDGLTPVNAGLLALGRPGLRSCTPVGVLELLADTGAELEGAEAVVVGRSNLFGKPMAQLLLAANATVTVCHSRTRDLREVCARADVLIVAVGRARLIGRDFVKPGAVVIDAGQNRLPPEQPGASGRLVGDVDFEAVAEVASAITPVPGGVGPMTVAYLLRNTLQAAWQHAERVQRQHTGEARS